MTRTNARGEEVELNEDTQRWEPVKKEEAAESEQVSVEDEAVEYEPISIFDKMAQPAEQSPVEAPSRFSRKDK